MNSPPAAVPAPESCGDLNELHAAVSAAIHALIACDHVAFQRAVERQQILCESLVGSAEWRRLPQAAATVDKIRELNRVYDRILRHSQRWARTLQSIFEAGGVPSPSSASKHFRG